MRIMRIGLLLLALAPLPAFAQNCGNFNDVPPGHPFCNDVEWLRNRPVTAGCSTNPPLYCPDSDVTRGQMAAFMARLGRVLTPLIVRATNANADGTYDPFLITCVTAPVPPPFTLPGSPGYPRQASFNAALWNYNASALKLVQAQLVYSTDSGTNWTVTPGDFVMAHTLQVGEHATLSLVGGPMDIDLTSTYLFALRLFTLTPVPTVEGECQLNVRVENRNPSVPPF